MLYRTAESTVAAQEHPVLQNRRHNVPSINRDMLEVTHVTIILIRLIQSMYSL